MRHLLGLSTAAAQQVGGDCLFSEVRLQACGIQNWAHKTKETQGRKIVVSSFLGANV